MSFIKLTVLGLFDLFYTNLLTSRINKKFELWYCFKTSSRNRLVADTVCLRQCICWFYSPNWRRTSGVERGKPWSVNELKQELTVTSMPGAGLPRDPNLTGIHRGVQHSVTYTVTVHTAHDNWQVHDVVLHLHFRDAEQLRTTQPHHSLLICSSSACCSETHRRDILVHWRKRVLETYWFNPDTSHSLGDVIPVALCC